MSGAQADIAKPKLKKLRRVANRCVLKRVAVSKTAGLENNIYAKLTIKPLAIHTNRFPIEKPLPY